MKKLQVGFIGLGKVAELHLAGCQDAEQIQIVAGSDTATERLKHMAKVWGFRGYRDYTEMLKKETLDFVCICTPPLAHRDITIQAAQHNVHVLCEKPMALSVEDATAMIAACDDAGVKLYYGSSYRCLPPCMQAKEMIEQGMLGPIHLLLETSIGGGGPDTWQGLGPHHYPLGGPGGSGMGLIDHGIHLADIFPWFVGHRVEAVFGRGNYSGQKPANEYLTMVFGNDAIGMLVYNDATFPTSTPYEGIFSQGASWDVCGNLLRGGQWDPQPGCIHVYGEKGALRIYHYANKLYFCDSAGIRDIPLHGRPNPGHFGLQMDSFARSIIAGAEPPVSGRDGLRALQVILAAYRSHETRSLVCLP
jgi:predicted dehydrogenase